VPDELDKRAGRQHLSSFTLEEGRGSFWVELTDLETAGTMKEGGMPNMAVQAVKFPSQLVSLRGHCSFFFFASLVLPLTALITEKEGVIL